MTLRGHQFITSPRHIPFYVTSPRSDITSRDSPGGHLPHLDRLVTRGAEDEVSGGGERHTGDVVVVAVHRLQAFVVAVEVPQLNRHVGTARH